MGLAWLLLGVVISPGIWRVARRLGESAARYQDDLSRYLADSRKVGALTQMAPAAVARADTVAVAVGDRAERIWNRPPGSCDVAKSSISARALEHAWGVCRLRYGDGSAQADAFAQPGAVGPVAHGLPV